MRRFELHRDEDTSGVSGTGVVAEGIQFSDGACALRWLSEHRSTAVYETVADVELIHGHGGRTRLVWTDQQPREEPAVIEQPELEPTLLSRRRTLIERIRAFQ